MDLRDLLTDFKHLICNRLSKSRRVLSIMSEFKRVMNSADSLLLSPDKNFLCIIKLIPPRLATVVGFYCLCFSPLSFKVCGSGELFMSNLILLKFSIFSLGSGWKKFCFYSFSHIFIYAFYMSVLKSQLLRRIKIFINKRLKLIIYLRCVEAWIDYVSLLWQLFLQRVTAVH